MWLLRRSIWAAVLVALLVGCATEWNVARRIGSKQVAPRATPTRNITNFAPALRCMDRMMVEYGVPQVSVLMEELTDQTGQVRAGTRDMMIAAVSDMTRRSRAIRVNAFGNDSGNLLSYITAAGRQTIFEDLPPYDVRGSISQLDRGLISEQVDAGGEFTNLAASASMNASGSVLGLDLSLTSTNDLSVVPGVYSRNSIAILESAKAVGANALLTKAGVNFNMALSESEGTAQAVRNLIELATVELFGRLFKLPYWSCLQIDPEHPDVQREISDWFYSMQADGELDPYVRTQLALRGYGDQQSESVPTFRTEAGLAEGGVDLALFRTLLSRPIPEERRALLSLEQPKGRTQPLASEPGSWPERAQRESASRPGWSPPTLEIVANAESYAPGEPLSLEIRSSGSGYLYCFLTDERGQVVRFFPNRFQSDGQITAERPVQVPGSMPFEITASQSAIREIVSCFVTREDILPWLLDPLGVADFERIGHIPRSKLRRSIRSVAGGSVGEAELDVVVRQPGNGAGLEGRSP